MATLNINVNDVAPAEAREYELLPAGWYTAEITSSEMRETKAGTGHYLSLEFTITDAEESKHVGRKVWTNLNLDNPNAQAVEIAYADLSAIGHAVGVVEIEDSEDLHGIPLDISVKVEEGRDGYKDRNVPAGYRACEGAAKAPKAAAKPAAGKTPPWAKKAG